MQLETRVDSPDPPALSARDEFVQAAVGYLLGERVPAAREAVGGDSGEAPPGRRASSRGGAGRALPDRPAASALGVRLVAELTGRSHAAPLFHFPDRLSLLAAVAAEGFRRQVAWVREHTAPDANPLSATWSGAERLREALFAYVRWVSSAPALWVAMYEPDFAPVMELFMTRDGQELALLEGLTGLFGGDAKAARRRLQAYQSLYDAKMAALLHFLMLVDAGQRDGSLRGDVPASVLSHAAVAVADGLAWQRVTEHQFTEAWLDVHARHVIAMVFEGLATRPGGDDDG
jgi:AcrR family transcriptional regulator